MIIVNKISDWVNSFVKFIISPIVIVLFFTVLIGVFTRYVLRRPMIGSFELCRVLFMWAWLMGSTVALKAKAHIGFDFLFQIFPPKPKKALILIGDLISIWFLYILAVEGFRMLEGVKLQIFPALEISLIWLYLPIPIAALIMILHFIATFANHILNLGKDNLDDEENKEEVEVL